MRKKDNLIFIFIITILVMGIGYAYLKSDLNINGITNISNASWNVYWDSVNVTEGSVTDVTTPATINTGKTEVSFNVNFTKPGDFYEFTVDAVNDGTIDAMIESITKGVYASNGTTPKTLPDYLTYSVTYSDEVEIQNNHLLKSGTTEKYKVRVEYKTDISSNQLPTTADNYMFKIGVTYKQADSNAVPAVPEPNNFSTDSWATIIRAVKANNISKYNVGDTKEINSKSSIPIVLRIANTTTPAECSTEGFSQTACGFVLEFGASYFATKRMNPQDYTIGGWPASEMREYVNDYVLNQLPDVLKENIIDTMVVSGHGSDDTSNFTSVDKMYLLATKEVGFDVDGDSAKNLTRTLDYYSINNTAEDRIKRQGHALYGNNEYWWLRSLPSSLPYYFYIVDIYGGINHVQSQLNYGVSPAFRIA